MDKNRETDIHPQVFISHASEDKERFVLSFARCLRENGIDAWVDEWEMNPGDSLIDKIFEEGIKTASAFIIILSKNSIEKPWVKEELNAALVERIKGRVKIIPIILDNCEPPISLQSTVWENIDNIENYESALSKIINSIFDVKLKPEIGPNPKYAQENIDIPFGLNKIDMLVLKESGTRAIEVEHSFLNTSTILQNLFDLGISNNLVYESLELLDENGLIDASRTISNPNIESFMVTPAGFEIFGNAFIEGFDRLLLRVLVVIINNKLSSNKEVPEFLDLPLGLVNIILEVMQYKGHLKLMKVLSGEIYIDQISTVAKRHAREISD